MSKQWEWAPPTLQEEIERKSFEALDWLITSAALGKLSDAQFSTGLDTLFMAVNGLVRGQAFLDLMSAAQSEADAGSVNERRVFMRKDGQVVVLAWEVGSMRVTVSMYREAALVAQRHFDFDSYAEAKSGLQARAQAFIKMGLTEI
ncbi:hypothetical protein [Cupriavidus campinensis]|uniref:Uncharacterized protein n=1 Tax=Cupriavidus campinensis TaxID=151783 RepID=A0ABY3ETW4_9BURK|nr:hypothetical protein [Cupriavidus campinensis]TSP14018.1 hypothetical protein FGG12_05985 [Cupriavidus campinensis]